MSILTDTNGLVTATMEAKTLNKSDGGWMETEADRVSLFYYLQNIPK